MMNLRVSDIKQYFYCPRIIYYTYCLPAPRPVTYPMQAGTVEHEALNVFERRRSLRRYGLDAGERRFHVSLKADALGLAGVLDMLIITQEQGLSRRVQAYASAAECERKMPACGLCRDRGGVSGQACGMWIYLSHPEAGYHSDFRITRIAPEGFSCPHRYERDNRAGADA